MSTLPAANGLGPSTGNISQTTFKTNIELLLSSVKEMPGGTGFFATTKTIASGAFTLEKDASMYKVNGEGSADDDLTNLNLAGGVTLRDGQIIGIQAVGPVLTLKHNAGGTRPLFLRALEDYRLVDTNEIVYFRYDSATVAFYQIFPDLYSLFQLIPGARPWGTISPTSNVLSPTVAVNRVTNGSPVTVNQISRTNFNADGSLLLIGFASGSSNITLAHNIGTVGKLLHTDNASIVLDSVNKYVLYGAETVSGTKVWREITRFGFTAASSGGDGFGGNGSRQIPTSGSISGDYYHDGDWTATGVLNIASGTRFFVRNASTFDFSTFSHVISTRPNSGGKGRPASGNNGAMIGLGSGPGVAGSGGGLAVSVVAGPGGAGFGGRGGRGGSYSDHYMPGGATYSPREFFGGTGGNSGMHYSSTATAAVDGGNAGGSFYLEVKLNPGGTCTLGNLNANGGAGVNAPDTNYSGSAGASGGCIVARIRGTAVLPAGRTISVNGGAGGSVGSGGTANAAGGGGGAGVIDIEATSWTNSGTLQANGGAAGSGGSYTATAGENSTPKALGLGYDPCSFW